MNNAYRGASVQHEPPDCGDEHRWYLPEQDKPITSVK